MYHKERSCDTDVVGAAPRSSDYCSKITVSTLYESNHDVFGETPESAPESSLIQLILV